MDLINRIDAIKAEADRVYKILHFAGYKDSYEDCLRDAVKTFKDIPSAEELIYEEMEKADVAAQAYAEGFKEGLESRKRGKWIKHISDLFPCDSTQECSVCHAEQLIIRNDDNFCPNCGAKMKERTK